jgi:type II secretory pathway pseudopilin PulG
LELGFLFRQAGRPRPPSPGERGSPARVESAGRSAIQNSKSRITNARSAFTLIEVVLAIGLTATLVYLLATAMELYMANVDASRTRVETAQLARTLLDQIANDLACTRLAAPASGRPGLGAGPGGPGGLGGPVGGMGAMQPAGGGLGAMQPGGGGMGGGGAPGGIMPAGPGGGGPSGPPGSLPGLFGNAGQLRIDRSAYANWERASRQLDPQELSGRGDMPVTVRYFFVDDNRSTTARVAQQGVARPYSPSTAAGLYRETIPTASIPPNDPPLMSRDAVRAGAEVELLAPEVVKFELAYFNGTDLVAEWDPAVDGGLPRGVEIRLTIAQPRFDAAPNQEEQQRLTEGRFRERELIEFRRFVRLPTVAAGPPAQPLLPAGGSQGGGGPGGPAGGQPGGGPPGGGQPGGGGGQPGGGQPGGGGP